MKSTACCGCRLVSLKQIAVRIRCSKKDSMISDFPKNSRLYHGHYDAAQRTYRTQLFSEKRAGPANCLVCSLHPQKNNLLETASLLVFPDFVSNALELLSA